MRRIGVLMHTTSDDPESQARIAAFLQGLQEAGWAVGRNLRIDTRWSGGDAARLRKNAADLVALNPDVILAGSRPDHGRAATVDPHRADRVRAGYRSGRRRPTSTSLAQPGGNTTGFTQFEYGLSGEMAGAAQGDRAAGRRAWRVMRESDTRRRDRTVGGHSGRGVVVRRGAEPDRSARRQRKSSAPRRRSHASRMAA